MLTFDKLMKALQYLNKYFYKYRTKLFLGFLITIIARIFSLFAPRLIGNSLTAVESYLKLEAKDLESIKNILLTNILIIIGTTLISGFFTFLMRQTIINVSRFIEFDLKNEIFLTPTTKPTEQIDTTLPVSVPKIITWKIILNIFKTNFHTVILKC